MPIQAFEGDVLLNLNGVFTSESVRIGHPDKLCDRIADAVLDQALACDPQAKVACEVLATKGRVVVAGEVSVKCALSESIESIVRRVIEQTGYPREQFDVNTLSIENLLHEQSPEIKRAVESNPDNFGRLGAGDQGICIGYAVGETPNLMPAPIYYAHALAKALDQADNSDIWPDGKTQVSVEYKEGVPVRIDTVLMSVQHSYGLGLKQLRRWLQGVLEACVPQHLIDERTRIYFNPAGTFHLGGPPGDTGLTGRKLMVDTYGAMARHGGGAMSGKDPSKVDRSGAYMARYLAKNVVAAGLADRCMVQLAYLIGRHELASFFVDMQGNVKVPPQKVLDWALKNVDMSPQGIIDRFDLLRPIYSEFSVYGQVGHDKAPWERTDMVSNLQGLI